MTKTTYLGWRNLALVVLAELVAFLIIARARRISVRAAFKGLGVSCAMGVPLGLLYDLMIGRLHGIFSYHVDGSLAFYLLNGIGSYGPALATAWLFPVRLPQTRSADSVRFTVFGLAVLVLSGGLLSMSFLPNMARAFALGLMVLVTGEAMVFVFGRAGPLLRGLQGDFAQVIRLWLLGMIVGGAYEAANSAFPLWSWSALASLPNGATELMMVVLGYFALFHPMLLLSRCVLGRPERSEPEDLAERE